MRTPVRLSDDMAVWARSLFRFQTREILFALERAAQESPIKFAALDIYVQEK